MPNTIRRSRFGVRLSGAAMKKSDQHHKWVEWNDEDQVYLGKCRDLITGIHGDDPLQLYADLCEVVEHFESSGRTLPTRKTRPMQEVA